MPRQAHALLNKNFLPMPEKSNKMLDSAGAALPAKNFHRRGILAAHGAGA